MRKRRLDSNDFVSVLDMFLTSWQTDGRQSAQLTLTEMLDVYSQAPFAKAIQGCLEYFQGNYTRSILLLENNYFFTEKHEVSLSFLARSYYKMEDYGSAIESCQTTLSKFPFSNDAWEVMGFSYDKQKNYSEATNCFMESLRIDDTSLHVAGAFTRCAIRCGRFKDCFRVFKKIYRTLDIEDSGKK